MSITTTCLTPLFAARIGLNEQREPFKLNGDGAKAIRAAVVALYAAVLLKFGCS
jgi:hypothetical protein